MTGLSGRRMPIDTTSRSTPRSRIEAEHRQKILQVAKGLSATIGADFFHAVVKHLTIAFHADCGFIGEVTGVTGERVSALAVFRKRRKSETFEQTISGAASGQVLTDGWFGCSREVTRMFPTDFLLEEMQAEGYAGIRLLDSRAQPIGVLAVISKVPLADIDLVRSVLLAFAPRAVSELERKRSDDVHRENEERYHAFVRTNPDAMWRIEFARPIPLSVDEDEQIERMYRVGYLAECNDAFAELAGAGSAEQLTGSSLAEITPRVNSNAQEELRAAVRCGFRSTTIVESTPLDASGRCLYRLRTQFGIVENGGLRRIWGTTRDITDLRRAELALAASERRFREVIEGIQLPAVMLDSSGRLKFCNEYFLRLVGRSREALSALNWAGDVVPAEETEIWNATLTTHPPRLQETRHFEGVILPADGRRRTIVWDTIGIRDEDDKAIGLAAIGRDIAYQK
jgi:two-component system cell cycle sensor histidine kinase/response regulator CckA